MKVVANVGFSGMIPVSSDRVQGTPRTSTKTPYCRRGTGRATRTPEEVQESIAEGLAIVQKIRQEHQKKGLR